MTDAERAHLRVVAQQVLAAQGLGFWLLANAVGLGFIALLLTMVPQNDAGTPLRDLALMLGAAWLILNGMFFWARQRSAGLRRDLQSPNKQRLRGKVEWLHTDGNALVYRVDGQEVRVYPALPIDNGFVTGHVRLVGAQTSVGAAVQLDRSAQGDRLLAVRHPVLDAKARLSAPAPLSDDEVQQLRQRAVWTTALVTAGVGAAGLLMTWVGGAMHWAWLWLLPMALLAALCWHGMRPQRWVGTVEAEGPVTETVEAMWRSHRVRRRSAWVRVAGQLFPVTKPPPLGSVVQLRARYRADGWPGETTHLQVLAPPPDEAD